MKLVYECEICGKDCTKKHKIVEGPDGQVCVCQKCNKE